MKSKISKKNTFRILEIEQNELKVNNWICKLDKDYDVMAVPRPFPQKLNSTIQIYEVSGVCPSVVLGEIYVSCANPTPKTIENAQMKDGRISTSERQG